MKEFSSGKKGAAIVMHQMFLIMMLCGIYGIGYNLRRHIGGLGILSLFMVIGMVGSFVFLAYVSGVAGCRPVEDATIYLTWIDKIYTDIQMALFVAFIYLVLFLGRNLHDIQFELSGLMVAVSGRCCIPAVLFEHCPAGQKQYPSDIQSDLSGRKLPETGVYLRTESQTVYA